MDIMSHDDQPASVCDDTTAPRVKILLHATDGGFPYLTPYLLHQCFVPNDFRMLQLGIAAQDTSIAASCVRANGKISKKPSGFKVSAFVVDEWLKDYPKVAVPTFDPTSLSPGVSARTYRTALQYPSTRKNLQQNLQQPSVNLNTLNGRVQVTHDDYCQMIASSSFTAVLPLFEHPPDESRPWKHVMERNFDWTVAALQSTLVDGSSVWLPVSIRAIPTVVQSIDSPITENPSTNVPDELQNLADDICEWMADQDETLQSRLSYVCFVDWHLVDQNTNRKTILKTFDERLPATIGMAILTTDSLEQLSLVLNFAQTTSRNVTVGTCVPTKLAQNYQALTWPTNNAFGPIEKKAKFDVPITTGENPNDDTICTLLKPTDPVHAHPWFKDSGPIDDNCSCLTCQDHNRSYLYHLGCSNELLVEILVFVHNLHQILKYCQATTT